MKLIFYGPPGAGKGTQAKLVADHFNLKHISTGAIFRKHIGEGSELGILAASYIDKGHLVPNDVTLKILKTALDEAKDGFLLDGYPRNLDQSKSLSEITDIDKVINIDITDEEAIKRQTGRRTCKKCGAMFNNNIPFLNPKVEGICDHCESELEIRSDAEPEIVKERLRVYHEQSAPALSYYEEQDKLVNINGDQAIDAIFEEIKSALED